MAFAGFIRPKDTPLVSIDALPGWVQYDLQNNPVRKEADEKARLAFIDSFDGAEVRKTDMRYETTEWQKLLFSHIFAAVMAHSISHSLTLPSQGATWERSTANGRVRDHRCGLECYADTTQSSRQNQFSMRGILGAETSSIDAARGPYGRA